MNRHAFLVTSFLALTSPSTVPAAEAKIRIVFFTPADVEPPADVAERMKEVVDYGQAFFERWLEHWGYDPVNVLPIDRDSAGIPQVYFVRGKERAASGAYDKVGFQGAVREQAISQYRISRQGSTWWIFVYGTQLRASRGYGGFSDPKGNGWALLVWHQPPGELSLDMPMSGGLADHINLKGYIHELGHTMNLAHFGPLDRMSIRAGSGMSLMGPNARSYRKARKNREQKVHLTEASAALIWKTPQMTGQYNPNPVPPQIRLNAFRVTYVARKHHFRIKGQLNSSVPAHSIIAINHPNDGPNGYWKKAFSSRLSKNGQFELLVDELSPSSGVLQVLFCFENGYITGTGQGYGYKFATRIPYTYNRRTFRIDPQK